MSSTPLYPHLQNLRNLLRQEKEADHRAFLELVREKPLFDRVAQGYTWYPLQVMNTGFALSEKAFVIVERTTHLNAPHQLRAGQPISLFTQAAGVDQPTQQGVINFVERNRMKIILNARDVPDWINAGQLGVDMLFDDRSYHEMERALEKVMAAKGDRLAELREILTAPKNSQKKGVSQTIQATTSTDTASAAGAQAMTLPSIEIPRVLVEDSATPNKTAERLGLNDSQRIAVQAILHNPDVAIIHGPPGTGKTTTLVAAIKALSQTEHTVLVTAPSNTAADLLTERLAAQGLNVVRIGNISRVDDSVLQHTVDALLAAHPEAKNIKKVKIEAAECRRQAARFKRSFGAEDRRERTHLKQQARDLDGWARMLEDRVVEEILSGAQAITCTLVGAAHPLLEKRRFRTCVIDEAAQALEPACWIPITKCSRVVLAGDPFQLPPTVKNLDAARQGLSTTLIERCLENMPDQVSLLTVQYRMHQVIMGFSNQYFYEGALVAHNSVARRELYTPDFQPAETGVTFIDTAGCGYEERLQENPGALHRNPSRFNADEAVLVREHLIQVLLRYGYSSEPDSNPGTHPLPSIGILSPYREQVNHLDAMFREDALLAPLLSAGTVAINTIDGFQGQERDVIYISLVRSNDKHEIGFLQDYRRMNVAMTRARMVLVVIGDSATIGHNKFYQEFLDYCAEHGAYRTAWEFMG
ncbi:MAG: Flp pilus assembly complex ATPase component TadA [Phycisphaerae bacterium]|nr:Flp pilus assembly complex ATPase component TadA [Saprospiraceae bacterium]